MFSDNWGKFTASWEFWGWTLPLLAHTSLVSHLDHHCHKSQSWSLLAGCTDTVQMSLCWDRSVSPTSVAPPALMSTNIPAPLYMNVLLLSVLCQSQLIYVESSTVAYLRVASFVLRTDQFVYHFFSKSWQNLVHLSSWQTWITYDSHKEYTVNDSMLKFNHRICSAWRRHYTSTF